MLLFLFVAIISADCTDCFDDNIYIWGIDVNRNLYGLSTCQGLLDCTIAICNILHNQSTIIVVLQIGNITRPNISSLNKITTRSPLCSEKILQLFILNTGPQTDCRGFLSCGKEICDLHKKYSGLIGLARTGS